jgi:hypothetical protein
MLLAKALVKPRVKSRSFLKEETIGAADLEETTAGLMSPDKGERTRKFAAQHSFGASVISIAVRAAPGEIIAAAIFTRVKLVALSSSKPAHGTFHNRSFAGASGD